VEQHDCQPPNVQLAVDELPKPWKCPDCGDIWEARTVTSEGWAAWIRLGDKK
jgi:predicted RNA-binding Zn-ribbon protein involved in translation (DUF1610 family)